MNSATFAPFLLAWKKRRKETILEHIGHLVQPRNFNSLSKFLQRLSFLSSQWKKQLYETLTIEMIYFILELFLQKAMAPHSSTFTWKIPRTEEPGRLQSMGLLRVGHNWKTSLSLFTSVYWRRKWQPTRVLAWRIPGMGEPGGLPSMGSHRVVHDWSNLAAAAELFYFSKASHNDTNIPTD